MDWFRSYIGTSTDPKFRVVAKKSGARLGDVLAVWQMLLERACGADERGRVDGFDCEGADALLDLDDGQGCAIYAAMEAKGLVVNGYIAAWEKRQPKREREDNSTERVRACRERKKQVGNTTYDNETPCNTTERQETPRGEESILNPPQSPPQGVEGVGESEVRQKRKPKIDHPAHGDRPQSYGAFKACYALYPIHQAAEEAWCEWCRLEDAGTLAPHFEIRESIIRHKDEDVRWKAGKAPLFSRWLNGKRWLDEPVTDSADVPEGPPPPKSYSDDQLAAMGIKGPTW